MALSNWDTLSHGPDSKPCSGVFVPKAYPKTTVEIYKNWIYVHSDMWKDGYTYVKDTIAEINSGDIDIAGVHITAIRHRNQSAIFVLATSIDNAEVEYFSGIGCYGFDNETWVGVDYDTKEAWLIWLRSLKNEHGDKFTAWLAKVEELGSLRFNQGDAYFASHLGQPILGTKTGDAQTPVIMSIIKPPKVE